MDRDVSGGEKTFTALAPEEQRELLEGVRELRALLTEEAAAPARDKETVRDSPAPPMDYADKLPVVHFYAAAPVHNHAAVDRCSLKPV